MAIAPILCQAKTNAKAGAQIFSFFTRAHCRYAPFQESSGQDRREAKWRLVSAMTFSFLVDIRQSANYSPPCRMSRGYMKKTQTDLLQGTLDLLVLKTLQSGPTHGWDIAQRIQQISQDVLRVGQGSLYPALHRLEAQGWIASEWGASENDRKAKYYKLTAAGRKQLL